MSRNIHEREFIGEGNQHRVFRSRNQKYVLKKPKFWHSLEFFLLGFSAKEITEDINEIHQYVIQPKLFLRKIGLLHDPFR